MQKATMVLIRLWLLLLLPSLALKQQVLNKHAAGQGDVQTSEGFSLQDSSSATLAREAKQREIEILAEKDQAAINSQQQVLEVLVEEQKKTGRQAVQLQAEAKTMEADERQMEGLVQQQSRAILQAKAGKLRTETLLQEQSLALLRARGAAASTDLAKSAASTSFSLVSSATAFLHTTSTHVLTLASCTAQLAFDAFEDVWEKQLIGSVVYVVIVLIAAFIYSSQFKYEYPRLKAEPEATRQGFVFSLFECLQCGPETPASAMWRDGRILVCSCCCMPVRWADTASSSKVKFMPFWNAVVVVAILTALSGASFFVTGIVFAIFAAVHRQKIRRRYGMPNGTCETYSLDICTWMFCPCCATMQEAMEVEYVSPPNRPWQHSMADAAELFGRL
eukprot:TRINITY_DN2870_c0_g2_i1.p1 TRINITY_DN2870_c0_g2~~TRINITY_DN2870_c0_g2_i1.p1  ORF type:complete len:391 (-),score=88.76 TRINITY_DN2870_c0_g2_i1:17-1189(-)